MRPLLDGEEWNNNLLICDVSVPIPYFWSQWQQNTIRMTRTDLDTTFLKFDKIFTSKFKQTDIFSSLENSIQRFLNGENHSFFA